MIFPIMVARHCFVRLGVVDSNSRVIDRNEERIQSWRGCTHTQIRSRSRQRCSVLADQPSHQHRPFMCKIRAGAQT